MLQRFCDNKALTGAQINKKVLLMHAMVLSIIGKDKPGLVDDVAKAVAKAQGNWLKSSFCHLSGHFAGFVEIMLPQAQQNTLIKDCHALSDLQITLMPANTPEQKTASALHISVTGNDRQGIVSDVTGALRQFDVNIVELATQCKSAPNWGSPMFSAKLKIEIPLTLEADLLKEAVENIADDLMVDISEAE